MAILDIRAATPEDVPTLQSLIQRAYRGDSARAGWTHEADLIEGERITREELSALIANPAEQVLLGFHGGRMIGCVRVADSGQGLAYLGLLCVDPGSQAEGLGKQLILAAEQAARERYAADRIEMTVIDRRTELIAFYNRRGYAAVGTRAFPIAMDPPLHMMVLEKRLA